MVAFTIERQPDSKLLVRVNGNAFHMPDTKSVEALLKEWGCSLEQIEEAIEQLDSGVQRYESRQRQRPRLNDDQLEQFRAYIDALRKQAGKKDDEIAHLAGFPSAEAVGRAYENGEASPIQVILLRQATSRLAGNVARVPLANERPTPTPAPVETSTPERSEPKPRRRVVVPATVLRSRLRAIAARTNAPPALEPEKHTYNGDGPRVSAAAEVNEIVTAPAGNGGPEGTQAPSRTEEKAMAMRTPRRTDRFASATEEEKRDFVLLVDWLRAEKNYRPSQLNEAAGYDSAAGIYQAYHGSLGAGRLDILKTHIREKLNVDPEQLLVQLRENPPKAFRPRGRRRTTRAAAAEPKSASTRKRTRRTAVEAAASVDGAQATTATTGVTLDPLLNGFAQVSQHLTSAAETMENIIAGFPIGVRKAFDEMIGRWRQEAQSLLTTDRGTA